VRTVKPFPFLNLAPELRLDVYSHLLPRGNYISLTGDASSWFGPPHSGRDLANVLRTCHQVHNEVFDHFYKTPTLFMKLVCFAHRFPTHHSYRNRDILVSMDSRARNSVEQLVIEVDLYVKNEPGSTLGEGTWLEILALLPSLKTVVFSFTENPEFRQEPNGIKWEEQEHFAERSMHRAVRYFILRTLTSLELRWHFAGLPEHYLRDDKWLQSVLEKRGGMIKCDTIGSD
jgi:hypothetical protein